MKPIRLCFEAFKSFPGREEIDFEALGGKGVFLVVGDTGTGKTSIFDAMTWVLYGNLPGERRGRGEPRSQHASPEVRTFVEMEFESGGFRYVVRREAEVERPKKRGTGTTKEEGDAFLARLTDSGTKEVASGRQQVTDACKELVGLELSQFEKVVLLPQGEFARFLIAAEGEREELLRKLFDGHLYERMTEILKTSAEGRRAEFDVEQSQVAALRDLAAGRLSAVIRERDLDVIVNPETLAADFAALEAELLDLLRAEVENRDALAISANDAAAALATAVDARERFDEVERYVRRKGELEAEKTEIDALRGKTEASAAGRPVKEAHEEVKTLEEQTATLESNAKQAKADLKDAKQRLSTLRADVKGRAKGAAAPLDRLSEDCEAWEALVTASRDLSSAKKDRETARKTAEQAIQAHRKSQASRLAEELETGKPCPVCGSKDHPKPATPTAGDGLGDGAVDEAQAAAEEAADAVGIAEGEVARLRGVLRLPVKFDLKDVPAGKKLAEKKLAEAMRLRGELEDLELDVAEVESEVEGFEAANTEALGELRERGGELKKAREQLTKAKTKSGFSDVDEAVLAVLDEKDEKDGRARVDKWDSDLLESTVGLEALIAAGPVPEDRPETDSLEADSAGKREAADAARDAVTRLEDALTESKRLMQEAAEADESLKATMDEVELLERVWKTCDGTNALKVSLERWVLAAELDRVVSQANLHLHDISRGRFALQRKIEEGKLGSLQLVTVDAWTGKERGTEMLSGGERFLASLALALGLADVISQGGTASGLTFPALFIDEGFDALSEDYLDLVADVLSDLHSGGRMVGAVTHVSSMRDRLPVGIEVTRVSSQGPSTLEVMV